MSYHTVLSQILDRRKLQNEKWGYPQYHTIEGWLAILVEEVGEVAEAILEKNPSDIRDELIDVAAVAVAAIEHMDLDMLLRTYIPPDRKGDKHDLG